ncbi:hypothetical protein L3X38_002697 [Prunus dulcis]|uniref:GRF-type domain-containing protein n=1 Tax=Prunus dulcis TaxID=3755 RepID=A0AAD4ZLB8_PRUDU|nr:hypothetical protein L3X38_002697 [Prunus dulcis]
MSQGSGSRNTWKLCECGGAIKRWTSRTDSNPRRRFEACENNRNRGKGHYWEWVDEEICPRGKEVLPRLLRRMRGMMSHPGIKLRRSTILSALGPPLCPHGFVSRSSRATSQWVTHPGIALAPNSLNFRVPTTPKSELNEIEEDNEGLRDKLRAIEQENKELTAIVGRLGRQRMKMDEKIMVYRHKGKLMWVGLFMAWVLGVMVAMLMIKILNLSEKIPENLMIK